MKNGILVFAFVLFASLAVGLEWLWKYHFFYIEQNQLFLFTGSYFGDMVVQPGGAAGWIAEFLVQFFALPIAGALITALLLTAVGVLTALICRRMAPEVRLYALWAMPVLSLLFIHFDLNYFYQGTVAFIAMQAAFLLYIRPPRPAVRLAAALISVPMLFWLCGPTALIYAVCVAIWEAANKTRRWYLSLLPLVEAAAVTWVSVHFSLIGEWTRAFSPHFYFAARVVSNEAAMLVWASLPTVIIASRLCRKLRTISPKREIFFASVQFILLAAAALWGVNRYIDRQSYHTQMLDHFSRTGQWDAIIERSRKPMNDYGRLSHLNLALASKGVLADELFRYDQHGVNGLFIPWDMTSPSAILRSDIYFCIGMIAGAQEMAFEGNVASPGYGNPRLLQRLVQTNLICGSYPVAEKYLDILSRTFFYRDWASEHRRFLYDDKAVEADPLLGMKRRCLPDESRFFKTIHGYLEMTARQNPESRAAMEYLGALVLLTKNKTFFRTMIESYYGTEVLLALPRSFQEAVVILYEDNHAMWDYFGVEAQIVKRFEGFKSRLEANKSKNGLDNLMRGSYGDTYWFYYLFKQL